MLALLLLSSALGADAFSLSADRVVPVGQPAALTVALNSDGTLEVSGGCDGHALGWSGAVSAGDTRRVEVDLPAGEHACSATVGLTDPTGGYAEMTAPFTVHVLAPIELSVAEEDLHVDERTVEVRASRPITQLEIDAFGPDGQRIGGGELRLPGSEQASIEWSQAPGSELVKLLITGRDDHGFGGKLELIPWHYRIPHEDVAFETGEHAIRPSEEPKLEAAWGRLQRVLDKYGDVVEVKLFVAGYTDTVGGREYNQGLSERRARAIARWFAARGFEGSIAYQGFGESALAVSTPDQTPEQANRRALYILAAQAPPPSHDIPRSAWTRLQ